MALTPARFAGQDTPGLYLVHPQDPEREKECTCDIFVVHGLRGGATKSWQHPESGIIWFQHLLPDYIRDQTKADSARIWTFGYPADVTFQAATVYELCLTLLNRVKEARKGQENRKIIWVCHSLGGIVVKYALVEAELMVRYRSIRTSTVGIVFLATPHRGSSVANFGSIVASVVNLVTPGMRVFNDTLRDLKKGSSALFETSSKFANICAGISIHTFYETGGGPLIVDRDSAVLNVTNEVMKYPLRVTHQEMGKFRDAWDQNWQPVASSILELVLLTAPSPQTQPPVRPNTSRPSYDPWTSEPESSTSYQPAPPLQGNPSGGYHQPSFRQPSVNISPQGRVAPTWETSDPARPAREFQPWTTPRDRPAPSDSGPSRSAYPPLNQSRSRLTLRPENEHQTGPASSHRSYSPIGAGSATTTRSPTPPDNADDSVAICDSCGRSIANDERRVQCTVCFDYDLCAGCFQMGKVSKGHSSNHKVSYVLNTMVLRPDDLVPAREAVNPPTNPARGRTNWTLVQLAPNTAANPTDLTVTQRRLHLFDDDSHARFRAYAHPGHYGVAVQIAVHVDPDVEKNAALRQQLLRRPGGLGMLRVTLGVVRNNSQFAGTRFAEDSFSDGTLTSGCLPNTLLQGLCGSVMRLDVGDQVCRLQPDSLLHVAGQEDSLIGIGLVVQWSGVPCYQRSTDPIVSVTVLDVTMYNVLDYNEPYIRAAPPSQRRAVVPPPPPSTTANSGSISSSGNDDDDDDDDDDGPTAEEFLTMLLKIQRAAETAQEKARLEAYVKQQLARQEQAKREAVAALYLQAMSEAIEEAQAEEERKRQEAALRLLFQSLGLQ